MHLDIVAIQAKTKRQGHVPSLDMSRFCQENSCGNVCTKILLPYRQRPKGRGMCLLWTCLGFVRKIVAEMYAPRCCCHTGKDQRAGAYAFFGHVKVLSGK